MKEVKAIVEAGACKHKVVIITELSEAKLINIKFYTACNFVSNMNGEFDNLNWKKGIFTKMLDSYIYKKSSQHLKHVDCPVPTAILKSIQTAIGIAIDQEVKMSISSLNTSLI